MICEAAIALALLFVELHGPTGQKMFINVAEVSSLREPIDADKHWVAGVHCVIVMTNGKTIAVGEDCQTVAYALSNMVH